ncbi:MAG: BC1872 family protein [Symbiobacteriia bacterium]
MPELTRETILAMKPGRELDALVVLKVFGRESRVSDGERYFCGKGLPPKVPNYSTDIADAWGLVRHSNATFLEKWTGQNGPVWVCRISPELSRTVRDAESAPEAICKAALIAVADLDEEDAGHV